MKIRVTRKHPGGTAMVPIHTEHIELQDLLKLCGAVPSGGLAKNFIQNGAVQVNGAVETRRGRKLRPGDEVRFGENVWRVSVDAGR